MNHKNIEITVKRMLGEGDENHLPIWVRPPKPGQVEQFTGLGKGKLYQLEKMGLVKTASLKPRGAVRGVKLFQLQSLLDYVESCSNQPVCSPTQADAEMK